MAKVERKGEQRVEVSHPDSADAPASIWAVLEDAPGGRCLVKPLHPYPDLKPEAGWIVTSGRPPRGKLVVESIGVKGWVCSVQE